MTENSTINITLPDQHEPNEGIFILKPNDNLFRLYIINSSKLGGNVDLNLLKLASVPDIGDVIEVNNQQMMPRIRLRIITVHKQIENLLGSQVEIHTLVTEEA